MTESRRKIPEPYVTVSDYPRAVTRRSFLMSWSGVAWGTFVVTSGLGALAMLRYMLPNVLFELPQVFKAGRLEDYGWDLPDDRYKESQKTWIVKLHKDWNGKPQLAALDTTCTHLGCTPNVLAMERKIKCPCHGSGFRFTGLNFEGPAPRPLERYAVSIDPVDGQLVVDKTRKFKYETGRWEDPHSYIDLSRAPV
jgi:cytochrome b6-f complex iron-sulfur subunit